MEKQVAEKVISDLGKKVIALEAQVEYLRRRNKELRDWRHSVRKAVNGTEHGGVDAASPMPPPSFDLSKLFVG